ncbi:MAG: RDD family protein [Eubacteriales bacterium]
MIYDIQKASIWKRFAAALLDFILILTIAVGIAALVSLITGYDKANDRLEEIYEKYEEEYHIDRTKSLDSLTEEEIKRYEEAELAISQDEEAINVYGLVINLTLVITSVSILAAVMIGEFAVPLLLKNGQTVGKKIFGIGVMMTNGTKLKTVALFIRAVLGKYTIETMIPVLILIMIYFGSIGILGIVILALILLLELILIISTGNNSLIHDLISDTVVIDAGSQKIFDSENDLIEYQKKIHADSVAKSPY